MSILLACWTDNFRMEAAQKLVEAGAPISHITMLMGSYRGLPGQYADFFQRNGVQFVDELSFYQPEIIRNLNREHFRPIDAQTVRALTTTENLFLAASDRMSFIPISVRDRRRLYLSLVQFWVTFIERNGITAVVFASTPHMGWDLVLLGVAQHLGITVRFFNPTGLGGRVLFRSTITAPEVIPSDFHTGETAEQLREQLDPPLREYASLNSHHSDQVFKKRTSSMNARVFSKAKNLLWMVANFRKEVIQSAFFYNETVRTYGALLPKYVQFVNEQRSLFRFYQAQTSTISYGVPYVFFGLHYQPERTTLPDGGVFEDQILAIEILSAAIPAGWLLYVKEHPDQFKVRMQGRQARSENFYRHLAGLKRVRLVEVGEDPVALATNAQCVATITGTVGWEAIQLGKPAIAFGNPWYAACESCFLVDSVDGCERAIQRALAKTPEEVEVDRLRFILFIREHLSDSPLCHSDAVESSATYDDLAQNLADRIMEELGLPHTIPTAGAV